MKHMSEPFLLAARLPRDQNVRAIDCRQHEIARRGEARALLKLFISAEDVGERRKSSTHLLVECKETDSGRVEGVAWTNVERRLTPPVEVRPIVARLIDDTDCVPSALQDAVHLRDARVGDIDVAIRGASEPEVLAADR